MTTLGVEVGLEPMPRQRAEVGMGRRENKLRASRELAGLPTQLLGSVSRSWKSWAHPAPLSVLEASPQPGWEKAQRDSFSPMCSLLASFRSQAGGFPTVHSVRSVRLKSGEEVLWASAGLVPWGGRTSWYFRDTSCKVDATTSLN